MEDQTASFAWSLSVSMVHSTRGSTGAKAGTHPVKPKAEATPIRPPPSGGNSSSNSDRSGSDSESISHSCYSSLSSECSFSSVRAARRGFFSEPVHASTVPFGTPQQQNCSTVPAADSKAPQTGCRRSEPAASPSSVETDVEAEAGNPLLPGRDRKGKKRVAREATARLKESQHGGPYSSTSAADGSRGDTFVNEQQVEGEDSSNPQVPRPPNAAEATSAGGGIPWAAREDRGAQERLDELSLLSFNAGLLEYKLCGLRVYQNPPFTQRRLHHIPAALLATGADIICLQEVYGEAHADFIIESTRHKLPFVGRRTSGGRFSLHNGLMVLSKYPIVHTHFHKFEDVTYIERCFASKGMLEVAIDVPSIGVIALFNIHLASGAVNPESRYVEDVRAAEIRQLLRACDAAADRGLVPLVIGDLNAAPHLCASNYKCFVEHGWRDCWLHVHGHQRHLLQHHLLHQQQLLEEQQLDDQGIELHDRHIRRDLFVRIRRQRRMQLLHGAEPIVLQQLPQDPSQQETASEAEPLHNERGSLQVPFPGAGGVSSDAESSDVEREQTKQLLGQRQRLGTRASPGTAASPDESTTTGSSTQQRGTNHFFDVTINYSASSPADSNGNGDSSHVVAHHGSLELSNRSSHISAASRMPHRSHGRSNSASVGLVNGSKGDPPAVTGLLGGYFGRAGGGVQLPFAFELPAAAAWAHREFFLTAKRRLIEQQQKWLGGGDKAPVLDVRLSLAAPQHQQRGVDATPLASDCSLASCSTAITAAQSADTALMSAAMWRPRGPTPAPPQSEWHGEGADGSVADWLLSDTDEETEPTEDSDVVIQCGPDAARAASAPCSRRDFTWDPENPLNSIGPHAGCHGLRCDYVFLPPHHFAGGLYPFLPVAADILMRDPRVLVDACCFGCFGEVMLVTLSDHYAVRITLRRSTDADIADFWGSCAAEAAALRHAAPATATNAAGSEESD